MTNHNCSTADSFDEMKTSSTHLSAPAVPVTPTQEPRSLVGQVSVAGRDYTDDFEKRRLDNVSPFQLGERLPSFGELQAEGTLDLISRSFDLDDPSDVDEGEVGRATINDIEMEDDEESDNEESDESSAASSYSLDLMRTKLLSGRDERDCMMEGIEMEDCDCADPLRPDFCSSPRQKDSEKEDLVISKWSDVSCFVAAMLANLGNASYQESCFVRLRMLAKSEGGRAAVGAAGGISAILHAINVHPRDAGLHTSGFLALIELCSNDMFNITSFVNVNGVRTVVQSMQQHPQEVEVQSNGMQLLNRLPRSPLHVKALRREKPARMLIESANRFPEECRDLALKIIYKL